MEYLPPNTILIKFLHSAQGIFVCLNIKLTFQSRPIYDCMSISLAYNKAFIVDVKYIIAHFSYAMDNSVI